MTQIPVRITHVGGPTARIEIGGCRILTDPVFDPAGTTYPAGATVKLSDPALAPDEIGPIDLVLLSHDHHVDNLDVAGRAFLPRTGRVLTTPTGAERLGGRVEGLREWETVEHTQAAQPVLRITAVPARHGPPEVLAALGDVTGWVVEWEDGGSKALYISGDTVFFPGLEEVGQRFSVVLALLHFGAARVGRYGPSPLTMTAAEGARLARALGSPIVVPIHYDGWAHLSEGRSEIEAAFAGDGLSDRLRFLTPGEATHVMG
jgi:L-ascorbate metabolism protein UlaG (beta-lactamase superfamily)